MPWEKVTEQIAALTLVKSSAEDTRHYLLEFLPCIVDMACAMDLK